MNPDVTLADFVEFFGKTKEEILSEIKIDDNEIRRQVYNQVNPKCESDARKMYIIPSYATMYLRAVVDNYFSIIENESRKNVSLPGYGAEMIYRTALDHLNKEVSILDYGCGSAIYSLNLYFMGFKNITVADIPHSYFKFLEFLCKKYGIGIKFIPIEKEYADLKDDYGYIICSEVLEHVWTPGMVILHLSKHLKPGGYMYLSTFFNDMNGHDPLHLKHNNIYQDVERWFRIVESTGLNRAFNDKNGVLKIFQKS